MGSFIAYKPNEQVGFLPFDIAGESPLDLQGRHKELALLDTAYQQQAHLVQIVASSGTGKTALLYTWLQRLSASGWQGVDAVYGWSFIGSQGKRQPAQLMQEFLDQALSWLGVTVNASHTSEEKMLLLSERLGQQHIVLALDAIPAKLLVEAPDSLSLHGLFKTLSHTNAGLCIICVEEALTLMTPIDAPTIQTITLENLSAQAGALLLKERGVQGDMEDLTSLSNQFANHALTLTLLGACLNQLLAGDLGRLDNIPIWLDKQVHGRHARRVLAAYDQALHKTPELALLYLLSVFEGAISRDDLLALLKETFCSRFPFLRRRHLPKMVMSLRCLKREKLQVIQRRLHGMNLLASGAESESLYLRPLVRDYFQQKLQTRTPEGWDMLCQMTHMPSHTPRLQHELVMVKGHHTADSTAPNPDMLVIAGMESNLTQALKTRDWHQAALLTLQLQECYSNLGNIPAAIHCARQSAAYTTVGRDQARVQQQVRALAELLQRSHDQYSLNAVDKKTAQNQHFYADLAHVDRL